MEEAEAVKESLEWSLVVAGAEEVRVVDGVTVVGLEQVGSETPRRLVRHFDAYETRKLVAVYVCLQKF